MKFVITLLFFVFTSCSWGQNFLVKKELDRRSTKLYEQAYNHVNVQQWSQAVSCLNELLKREPTAIDALLFRAGIQHDKGDLAAAEKDFEAALLLSSNYAPLSIYQLAVTEYKQEKYLEAAEHFERYLTEGAPNNRRKERAESYLIKANAAAQLKSNPVPFEPKSLGDSINTAGKEYLPSFTADGQFLVYTVNYNGQEDFYFSIKDENDQWKKGKPFDAINTMANEGAQSIAANGKTLVFAGCQRKDGLGSCDLYYTEYENGQWGDAKHPGEPLNTRFWESQPSLSSNGKWLFFASDRPGGLGGNDIWVSGRQKDGSWGKPFNLGAPINTSGNDEAPFIHPDGQTFYFMSDGHPGLGGYDLFLSRLENGQYQQPENLGYPINTVASEGALVVSFDGKTAYYTTNENTIEGKKQNFDIYQFPLYTEAQPKPVTYVSGKIIDHQTAKAIAHALVVVKKEDNNQAPISIETDENGLFMIVLPAGENYQFNVEATDYLFFSERFEFKNVSSIKEPFKLEILLHPISDKLISGQEVVLRNVLFENNSNELLESSTDELNRLAKLLEQNIHLNIRINGHTDNIGTQVNNQTLSENRAKAVTQFLIDAGIAKERLSSKGFGEMLPIADNSNEDGRSENRRTSFEVVE